MSDEMLALFDDLIETVVEPHISRHGRSQQTRIGPSGLGTPCARKLGYRLAQIEPLRPERPAWRPTVGTAVHTWFAEAIAAANAHIVHDTKDGLCTEPWCDYDTDTASGYAGAENVAIYPPINFPPGSRHLDRWLSELNTPVGTINGEEIDGTLDVYDRLTGTLIDLKVPGPTALKDYRRLALSEVETMSPEYRVQVHTYARGARRALGLPVKYVAILFLPMNGELGDAVFWYEEYDPEIAAEAFKRARIIDAKISTEGQQYIGKLKRTFDYCHRCPFFEPAWNEDEHGWAACPGAPSMHSSSTDVMEDLLGSAKRGDALAQ